MNSLAQFAVKLKLIIGGGYLTRRHTGSKVYFHTILSFLNTGQWTSWKLFWSSWLDCAVHEVRYRYITSLQACFKRSIWIYKDHRSTWCQSFGILLFFTFCAKFWFDHFTFLHRLPLKPFLTFINTNFTHLASYQPPCYATTKVAYDSATIHITSRCNTMMTSKKKRRVKKVNNNDNK